MPILANDPQIQDAQPGLFGSLNRCRIEPENGALAIYTPFSPEFVAELKLQIPANLRSWNPPKRAWLVDASQAQTVINLISSHFGETVVLPAFQSSVKDIVSGTFAIEYIGRCKPRGDGGENIAFGFAENNWSFIFSEKVLRTWFERTDEPEEKEEEQKSERPKTFYQILRVKHDVLPIDLKKGYHRMARQWHPDVCREEDARERFEQIKKAYDILSNPKTRKRYDLGLKLQKQAAKTIKAPAPRHQNNYFNPGLGYSPDLRCGLITLTGHKSLGKIIVENITAWEDIENQNGDYLVSSWNFDLQQIEKIWISRNVIF